MRSAPWRRLLPLDAGANALALDPYFDLVRESEPAPLMGRVTRSVGLVVESMGPKACIGDVCEVRRSDGAVVPVEIVGFREGRLLSVPLGDTTGIQPGDRLVARGGIVSIPAGPELLGRVIDGLGHPIDGRGPLHTRLRAPLRPAAMNPLSRDPIAAPMATGVRAIDALLTCGRGQRIGLFGGSGVGKSTLLGMMARGTAADVVVLALVGERGREVRSFLEHDLGPGGLARSVVVVSTSDSPPLVRLRAAYGATAIAEYFRDLGKNVLLMMDSVTRFAMAQREVGLAAGEPPTAKGYPPSVFATTARLARACRQRARPWQHHRDLLRARRRRRHQRADRRRGPRHSRRPHRALSRSGRRAITIRRLTCWRASVEPCPTSPTSNIDARPGKSGSGCQRCATATIS